VLGEITDVDVEGVKLSDIIGQKVEFILGPTGAPLIHYICLKEIGLRNLGSMELSPRLSKSA
jgi:hypothetical protein